jgi:hypothetical protein
MRAAEFIFEAYRVGILKFNGFEISVDKHSMEQAVRRNVLPSDVDRVLKKITGIQDEIRSIPGGQKFWVFSPTLDVGIGFRKSQDDSLKLILKTVTGSKPYDGPTPILIVENFADGKNPGRKGLAKRSGVNTKASVSSLRKTAKNSSGEKQRMAHWLANMKAGRAKKNK